MPPGHCKDCGRDGRTTEHHFRGRKEYPNDVVWLCPNCHDREHAGLLLWHNAASVHFLKWWDAQLKGSVYVTWAERRRKLDELGYIFAPDGEEDPRCITLNANANCTVS